MFKYWYTCLYVIDPTPIAHRVIYGNFSFKEYRNDNGGDKIWKEWRNKRLEDSPSKSWTYVCTPVLECYVYTIWWYTMANNDIVHSTFLVQIMYIDPLSTNKQAVSKSEHGGFIQWERILGFRNHRVVSIALIPNNDW